MVERRNELKAPRGSRAARREPLSRERIERAALELIEREGVEGASTRKLGALLGVRAMSIYHYFPSKAHLLDALVDRVLAGMPPLRQELAPMERLRRAAYAFRDVGLKYPRFFLFLGLHRLNSREGLNLLNGLLGCFCELGLNDEQAARYFRALGYYLIGAIQDETLGYSKGPSSMNPVPEEDIAREFPHVARAAPFFAPHQVPITFEAGLGIMLAAAERAAREASRPA